MVLLEVNHARLVFDSTQIKNPRLNAMLYPFWILQMVLTELGTDWKRGLTNDEAHQEQSGKDLLEHLEILSFKTYSEL